MLRILSRSLLPLGLSLVSIAGCSSTELKSGAPATANYKNDDALGINPLPSSPSGVTEPTEEAEVAGAAGANAEKNPARRIVYNATVSLFVERFDPVPEQVNALAKRYGAYVARSQIVGSAGSPRSGHWTLRVPSERFEEFLVSARQVGEVQSISSDSKDVTEEYYDIDARVRNKKQEESRLLDLLAKAPGRLDDVLNLERELTRVRGEVEQLQGRLRVLGSLAAMGTVILDVNEVKNYVPEKEATYAMRVRRAWDASTSALTVSLQVLSIAAVAALPWIAVGLLPCALMTIIIRHALRKNR